MKHIGKYKKSFQPLVIKITEYLHKQGDIRSNDLIALKTLAAVNHISELTLNELIAQIIQQQSMKSESLAAFIQWNKLVNSCLTDNNGKLSTAELNHLLNAGVDSCAVNNSAESSDESSDENSNKNFAKSKKELLNLIKEKQRLFTTHKSSLKSSIIRTWFAALIVLVAIMLFVNKQMDELTPLVLPLLTNDENSEQQNTSLTELSNEEKQPAITSRTTTEKQITEKQITEKQIIEKLVQVENIKQAQALLNNLSYRLQENGVLDNATNTAINHFLQTEQLPLSIYTAKPASNTEYRGEVSEELLTQLENALDRKDDIAWQVAANSATILAYQTYLQSYKQGQHRREAQHFIDTLINKEQQEKQQQLNAYQQQQNSIAQQAIEQLLNSFKEIPAGKFTMGCDQVACKSSEQPTHTVIVPAFSMMATEVTFAMWDACVIKKGCAYKPDDLGWGRNQYPVINISYQDIINEFIPWLNQLTGQKYSLPSEAQWEYSAQIMGEKKSQTSTLSCLSARYGQFSGECGNERRTIAVQNFPVNDLGLYDLQGNVWEWNQDCWNDSYNNAPVNGSAWLNGQCDGAVLRGGSWLNNANALRTSARRAQLKSSRANDIGFRLVLNK